RLHRVAAVADFEVAPILGVDASRLIPNTRAVLTDDGVDAAHDAAGEVQGAMAVAAKLDVVGRMEIAPIHVEDSHASGTTRVIMSADEDTFVRIRIVEVAAIDCEGSRAELTDLHQNGSQVGPIDFQRAGGSRRAADREVFQVMWGGHGGLSGPLVDDRVDTPDGDAIGPVSRGEKVARAGKLPGGLGGELSCQE